MQFAHVPEELKKTTMSSRTVYVNKFHDAEQKI